MGQRGLKHIKRPDATVRWGHLREIDKRIRVGTRAFNAQPLRLRHLMAWRRMNSEGHEPVKMYGTRIRVRPSSNINIKKKVEYCRVKIGP